MTNQFDDDFFDDDFDDFDDAPPDEAISEVASQRLSEADRQARAEQFQKEVDKRIQQLMKPRSYDAKTRREAARWLGESGEVSAIPPLVKVYEKDPTPGMKETAAYALGQFKALEQALSDPDREIQALDNIEQIVMHQKFGKRNEGPGMVTTLGLLASFVVLMVGAVFINANSLGVREEIELVSGEDLPTNTPDTIIRQEELLREYYLDLRQDARTLQTQFSEVSRTSGAGGQDCSVERNNPSSFTLSTKGQESPQLVDISETLNETQALLQPLVQAYNAACRENRALTRDEVANEYRASLTDAQNLLLTVPPLFQAANVEIPPTPPPPTEAPTAAPTIPPEDLRAQIDSLEFTLSEVIGDQRAPANRLQAFWTDVQESGSTGGCRQADLIIPEDYTLPPDIAERVPELARAADNVNLGLQLTRQSLQAFTQGCNNNNLSANVGQQLDIINTAISAFSDAQDNLQVVRRNYL